MESRPVILCGRRTTQRRLRYGCPGFDERCSWNTVASNCSTVLFLMLIRASFSSLRLLYTRSLHISIPLPRLCNAREKEFCVSGCPWEWRDAAFVYIGFAVAAANLYMILGKRMGQGSDELCSRGLGWCGCYYYDY